MRRHGEITSTSTSTSRQWGLTNVGRAHGEKKSMERGKGSEKVWKRDGATGYCTLAVPYSEYVRYS